MTFSVGAVLYVIAVLLTVVVVASKYFALTLPKVTAWAMRDPAQSLLLALALALVSRWL